MPTDDAPPRRPLRAVRATATLLLLGLAGVAGWFLLATPTGHAVRTDPRQLGAGVRQLVAARPALAVALYLSTYLVLALLCLPVMWLLILSGVAFGLWGGCGLSVFASAASAAITAGLADWLAGAWFHGRVEKKMGRLRRLDDVLGHNGFLVVMSVRLTHVLPFGLSNIALGLSRVSLLEVGLGTLLGNVPAIAVYVGVGAGYQPLTNWRFDAIVGGINVLLLVPLAARYLRPAWFGRVGVQ